MIDKEKSITGIINLKNKNVIFCANKYEFTFMAEKLDDKKFILESESGFLTGKTYNGHDIIIPIGQSKIICIGSQRVTTNSYILGTSNKINEKIDCFDCIDFVGGTLNNLFLPRGFNIDREDSESLVLNKNNDALKYDFMIDNKKCKITICSSYNDSRGQEGFSIENKDVHFKMKFSEPQNIDSFFYHYNKIKDLMSFMTYREKVGFDKISLIKKIKQPYYYRDNSKAYKKGFYAEVSQIYIKEEELTKKYYGNLKFTDLGDSLINLLEIFYKNTENKPTYALGFFQKNDDGDYIDYQKIREICTSIECELLFIKRKEHKENETLENLKKDIKKIVKDYRKKYTDISDKTYDTIFSSMKYWESSLSDRIKATYPLYIDALKEANTFFPSNFDEEIDRFCLCRNDITHGRHRIITPAIATISYLMGCLVYCCLLKRIGLDEDKIKELIKNGLLN